MHYLRSGIHFRMVRLLMMALMLPQCGDAQSLHAVKSGDTLYGIAQDYGVSISKIMRDNNLTDSRIFPGQELKISDDRDLLVYEVRSGDTLSDIAVRFDVEEGGLRVTNGLTGDTIYIGQRLRIPDRSWRLCVVGEGDSLWEIARENGATVAELMALNGLESHRIYPGQSLRVASSAGGSEGKERFVDLVLESSLAYGGDLYYFSRPKAERQIALTYEEISRLEPAVAYRNARYLLRHLDARIAAGNPGRQLADWHIVIDPGHGGFDPGAIVESLDGNGHPLYVCEDEYVYDVALRLYVLLKLQGAHVYLTLLSPNHLIRHTVPPSATLVNEKNEVFNDEQLNRGHDYPRGDSASLRKRVEIAGSFVREADAERTIFVSLHADNSPHAGKASSVWYLQSAKGVDDVSLVFAEGLVPHLGAGAYAKGGDFAVLRDSELRFKVLIEVRNLAFLDHSWALRFEELRQADAESIAGAIRSNLLK